MSDDIKGLDLSRKYYEAYGCQMLHERFQEIEDKLAIGLIGSGSECFGFDDEISRDHDFEPGFCIFLPGKEVVDDKTAFDIQREYSRLPDEFMGFKRQRMSPVGGSRHGVVRINEFFKAKCGSENGVLSSRDWLFVPEYSLAEAVNGEVFRDDYRELTRIRDSLSYYPKNVKLKKLAGYLLLMAQAGQYNFMRCADRKEYAAAQLCVYKYVEAGMHIIFLLNGKYMPYYKWSFAAFRSLDRLGNLYDSLEYLISSDNEKDKALMKSEMIEDIAALIIRELKADGLTDTVCNDLEKHAYSVNDHISDGDLRNMDIFAGV